MPEMAARIFQFRLPPRNNPGSLLRFCKSLYLKALTDTRLLAEVILANLGSREFLIKKAIGWSLRDYSKTDRQWVNGFIAKHRDRMHPLSIREGGKYL